MVFPEAPFKIGLHLRVVRHHIAFLQCLESNLDAIKVKGEYNYSSAMTAASSRRRTSRRDLTFFSHPG
eukprot:5149261-Amphidinium_carterae.1